MRELPRGLRDRPGPISFRKHNARNPVPSSSVTSLGQDVCVAHTMPMVGGEPFDAKTARAELEAEGLIVAHRKLKRWNNQGFKPKGSAKQVGGKTVYPHL